MQRALEAVQIGDAGLIAAPRTYPLQKLLEETSRLVLRVLRQPPAKRNPEQQVSVRTE
jgi:hypothetical protein